jgi:dihydropyrimidinase
LGKVGPSIKSEADRQSLWGAVREGLFDSFGSDHAPKDKTVDEDFFKAAYGSPEVETMLPVIWHCGVNAGIITPNEVVALLAENSARILGLSPRKGRVAPGADADLVLFDPAEPWTIQAANQHTNARYSLFEGREVLGRVRQVFSAGELLVDGNEFLGSAGAAHFLPTRAGRPAARA